MIGAPPSRGAARRAVGAAVFAVTLSMARADEAPLALYETVTIVTGQRPETRVPGIRRCFIDVLQKVSGDATLAEDADVARLAEGAEDDVTAFRYHDRLWKRPIHDEQGTRDRPHNLTVDFDPGKIDAALRSLGREPWLLDRPRVAVFVAVLQGDTTYVTSTDGPNGYGQADAVLDTTARTGVPVVVPDEAAVAGAALSYDRLLTADPTDLAAAAARLGAAAPLLGTMRFSDADLGWIVDWRFAWKGAVHRWRVSGVNFDAAFLNGMRGVAQIVSGHGSPH